MSTQVTDLGLHGSHFKYYVCDVVIFFWLQFRNIYFFLNGQLFSICPLWYIYLGHDKREWLSFL